MRDHILPNGKPFDIRERVLAFVLDVIKIYPKRRVLEPPDAKSWSQFFNAASSSGAHLQESDGASSHRHFTTLNRGALREMREAKYWLRVITEGKLEGHQRVADLRAEASELVAIMTTIVKKATGNDDKADL
jgi:four helix bundle protein